MFQNKSAYEFFLAHREDPALYGRDFSPHLTTSGLVLLGENQVLMVFHKIFKSWSLPGGHVDGDRDLEASCRREILEETGLDLKDKGVLLDLRYLPVQAHIRRGQRVSAHDHLNLVYYYQISKTPPLRPKEDENEGVDFLDIQDLDRLVGEAHMLPFYQALLAKASSLRNKP